MLAGPRATRARVHQKATASPAVPPSRPSRRLSVRNCRTSRARPAPSADRTATSRVRDCARASSRFATLTQAISSTKVTAPSSTSSAGRTLRTIRSCSGTARRSCRRWFSENSCGETLGDGLQSAVDCVDVGVGLQPRAPRNQLRSPRFGRQVARREDERLPDIRRPAGTSLRRRDADNRAGQAVEDGWSSRASGARRSAGAKPVAQMTTGWPRPRPRFDEGRPARIVDAEHIEEVPDTSRRRCAPGSPPAGELTVVGANAAAS